MLTHKGTQTLHTSRLTLRRFEIGDARAMYDNWASDPEVSKFLTWPTHESLEVTQKVVDNWVVGYESDEFYQWAIVLNSGGDEPIGSISVVSHDNRTEKAHIGYCIGKRWWHQGIMSEALRAVISYLFDEVGMQRVEARHDPDNPHSGGVMRKCGMTLEGTQRHADWNNQGLCDSVCYAILAEDRRVTLKWSELYRDSKDEEEHIKSIYKLSNEDTRLNRSRAARVEFLTNTRYIERYLTPGARILDVGAGAGEYSLYFAEKGYRICALELSETNIEAFRKKIKPEHQIELVQGNAVDLSRYEDGSFDAVLLFGPLYHLHREHDRQRCIAEAKRVCKPNGTLFFAFISNDMVILTEFACRPDYFTNGDYNKETFELDDFPFVFHTVSECREMLHAGGIRILHEVASDGVSELMEEQINKLDDEGYAQYLRYHSYICEKPELLGMSNHLLFVGKAE